MIFPTVFGYNRTVANIEFPSLGFWTEQLVYCHSPPCDARYGMEQRRIPLFITPNIAGNTTVTIRAGDAWGGKDTETFQVIVYDPVDPYHAPGWGYGIPRDLFPYRGWEPWR